MRSTEHNHVSEVRLQRADERVMPHTVCPSRGRAPFTCGQSAARSNEDRLGLAQSAPGGASESCCKHTDGFSHFAFVSSCPQSQQPGRFSCSPTQWRICYSELGKLVFYRFYFTQVIPATHLLNICHFDPLIFFFYFRTEFINLH